MQNRTKKLAELCCYKCNFCFQPTKQFHNLFAVLNWKRTPQNRQQTNKWKTKIKEKHIFVTKNKYSGSFLSILTQKKKLETTEQQPTNSWQSDCTRRVFTRQHIGYLVSCSPLIPPPPSTPLFHSCNPLTATLS